MHFSIWRKPNLLELFMALFAGSSLLANESQVDAKPPDTRPATSKNSETRQEVTFVSSHISVPVPEKMELRVECGLEFAFTPQN